MFLIGNSKEGNRFESERWLEAVPAAAQVLIGNLFRIRSARMRVETALADLLAEQSRKSYQQNVEQVEQKAMVETAKAVEATHNYPLADNSPSPDEGYLDQDAIREVLKSVIEPENKS